MDRSTAWESITITKMFFMMGTGLGIKKKVMALLSLLKDSTLANGKMIKRMEKGLLNSKTAIFFKELGLWINF